MVVVNSKCYPEEFKAGAPKQALEHVRSVREVATRLGGYEKRTRRDCNSKVPHMSSKSVLSGLCGVVV